MYTSLFIVCIALSCANGFHWKGEKKFRVKAERIRNAVEINKTHPWFCRNLDCPAYEVENKTKKFELRAYHNTRFAHVKTSGYIFGFTMARAFMPLFRYITGKNSESRKMNMTVPVVAKIKQAGFKIHTDTHFYMPDSYGKLPTPDDKNVKIITYPKSRIYVRSFTGYVMTVYQVIRHHNALIRDLDNMGLKYKKHREIFYTSYNRPSFRRRNNLYHEIWVFAM